LRVNSLVIDAATPGLSAPASPYPWSGTYFRGNAVTVTALPAPGSVFVRWIETGETTAATTVMPLNGTVTRTAEFAADGTSGLGPDEDLPTAMPRLTVAPNPFNPQTTFSFELITAGPAHLEIYDLSGRRVRTLAAGDLAAGRHEVRWDGRDQSGRAAPSGGYLGRLRANGREALARLQLVR
ncbi:hypothetical protein FJ250_10050, partial [bacterium]|nr:hypothetical protein [bacterium]